MESYLRLKTLKNWDILLDEYMINPICIVEKNILNNYDNLFCN